MADPQANEYWRKGHAALGNGNAQEAIEFYDAALAIDPRAQGAIANKGAALLHLKRYKEAIEERPRLDRNTNTVLWSFEAVDEKDGPLVGMVARRRS